MTAFYWSRGAIVGSAVEMNLTIAGELFDLTVLAVGGGSVGAPPTPVPVPVQGFQRCIPVQTVACGPVPIDWLPLTATGHDCNGPGRTAGVLVATVASPAPSDGHGVGPWCDALTAGGVVVITTPGGGGSPPTTKTAQEICEDAQHSALLTAARSQFDAICASLRSAQQNVALYAGLASGFLGAAAALATAAAAAGANWVGLALGIAAFIAWGVACLFMGMASAASALVGVDEALLDTAQQAWENAIAAARTACCAGWITINTGDLVCP